MLQRLATLWDSYFGIHGFGLSHGVWNPTLFLHVWPNSGSGQHVSAAEEALVCLGIRNTIINSPLKLCKGAAICDDIFIVAPLQKQDALALVAKLNPILKQDLLDLDVRTFNWYLSGNCLDDNQARKLFQKQAHENFQNISKLTVLFGSHRNGCGVSICVCVYVCGHVYMYIYACVYVFVHLCIYKYVYVYAYLCIDCGSWYQCFSVWTVSCMRMCFRVHMYAYTYVCRYICMCIFLQ